MYHKRLKLALPKIALSALVICVCLLQANAQELFFKDAIKENRQKFYARSIQQTIINNLSSKLNTNTEEGWISAFGAINLFQYKTEFVNKKVDSAARYMKGRSNAFKKALIELLYSDYGNQYHNEVKQALLSCGTDFKLMAIAANYLLKSITKNELKTLQNSVEKKLSSSPDNAILQELKYQLLNYGKPISPINLRPFFDTSYLKGQVIVFSFQRKNRNYPGLAMVRNANGYLLKNADSTLFTVGQLARSGNNLPGYISMGNTPQGIFRMSGFDVSKGYFIGPTPNIQLTMPFEYKASHFFQDSTLVDTLWELPMYKNLLPKVLRDNRNLCQSYFAGKAGRTEIIAHGTTVDPSYYTGKPYYPYTPTAGCLATKEIWDEKSGYIKISDQKVLNEAVKKAGGANGYFIVIEVDDKPAPVTIADISKFLN